MVASKLVYNGQPVGVRFSEIPFKKGISADMSYDVGRKIVGKFERNIYYWEKDVPVKLINGSYISNNEQGAVEILSYDELLGFIRCNPDVVAHVYERSGIKESINNGRSNNGKSHFFNWDGIAINLEKNPNIVQLEDRLRVASNTVICDIGCRVQSFKYSTDASTYIEFPNLFELSKFIHEWYKYKNYISIVINDKENFSVNSVKDIYNELKSITHSKNGYDYDVSKLKCYTMEEFSLYPFVCSYDICIKISTNVLPYGYEANKDLLAICW